MKKIVVVFSHPNVNDSIVNKKVVEILKNSNLNIDVRHIDQLYPTGNIDVAAEQGALVSADVVVFQHPVYWYSVTPALKNWIDQVLTYGFAYGSDGDKLKGKKFIHSVTTGGPAEAYGDSGLDQLLLPIKQSANMVQLDYVQLVPSYGNNAHFNPGVDLEANAIKQGEELIQLLASL